MKYAVGIDIGGTNTRVALINKNLEIEKREQFKTDTQSPTKTLEKINEVIQSFGNVKIVGIGMSCPGPLDLSKGEIITTPNLGRDWFGFPLVKTLETMTNYPVILDNDANLATLAEAVVGEGKNYSFVQFVTVSTGIGSGLVINGKIQRGAHGFGGEVANLCVWENGPQMGQLVSGGIETISSGSAIVHRAKSVGLSASHAGEVNQLALAGNSEAKKIIEEAKLYLANFIAILYAVSDPDIVILGGSVALKIPNFAIEVEALVKKKVFAPLTPLVKVVTSTLNEESGLLGAGILAFDRAKA